MKKIFIALLCIISVVVFSATSRTIYTDTIQANTTGGNVDIATGLTLNSSAAVDDILDEDDLVSDSATALVTQQSVKAYVDGINTTLSASVSDHESRIGVNEADIVTIDASIALLESDVATHTASFPYYALLNDPTQTITASKFIGDGSGLSGITASVSQSITQLTDVNITSAATNETLIYDGTNWVNITQTATNVKTDYLSGDLKTVQDFVNIAGSAGIISGGDCADNGDGTFAVSAISAMIKTSDTATAPLVWITVDASPSISVSDDSDNYVYVDYNSGSPLLKTTNSSSTILNSERDKFEICEVYKNSTMDLHITTHKQYSAEVGRRAQQRLYDASGNLRTSGMILSDVAGRHVAVTAGTGWVKLDKFSTNEIDTSVADTFIPFYNSATWTASAEQTQYPVNHYDNAGTLTEINNNWYACHYWWLEADTKLIMVYGQDQHVSLAAAEAEVVPTPPDRDILHGIFIAKTCFQKGATSFSSILNPFGTQLSYSAASDHNNLSNVDLAANGVTYGHISDTTQTIDGAKTFSDALTAETTVTASYYKISDPQNNVFIMNTTMPNVTTAAYNMYIGQYSANPSLTIGNYNTVGGYNAGKGITLGDYNSFWGYAVGSGTITGYRNSCYGGIACQSLNSGEDNVGVGYRSVALNNSGSYNTGVGSYTLIQGTANSRRSAFGYGAGYYANEDDVFVIDNRLRSNNAQEKTHALMYGYTKATPNDSTLSINANVTVTGSMLLTGVTETSTQSKFLYLNPADNKVYVAPSGSGSGFTDPMTTSGDIIIRDGVTTTRLGIGAAGQVLTTSGGLPSWQDPEQSPLVSYILGEDLLAGALVTLTASNDIGIIRGLRGGVDGIGSTDAATGDESEFTDITYNTSTSKVAISYRDVADSYHGYFAEASVTGTTIDFSTPIKFYAGSTNRTSITYSASGDKYLIAYIDNADSGHGKVVACDSSACGTPTEFYAGTIDTGNNNVSIEYIMGSEVSAIAYRDASNNGMIVACWISTGTTIVCGSATEFEGTTASNFRVNDLMERNAFAVSWINDPSAGTLSSSICSVSGGSTITCGVEHEIDSATINYYDMKYNKKLDKLVCALDISSTLDARAATITGTSTITWGDRADISSSSPSYISLACLENTGGCVSVFNAGGSAGKYIPFLITEAGADIGTEANVNGGAGTTHTAGVYLVDQEKLSFSWEDASNGDPEAVVYNENDRAAFFGILQESGSLGESKKVARHGQVSSVHAGALLSGTRLYIQEDNNFGVLKNDFEIGISLTASSLLITY